jgi:hypothetical protein
VTLGQTRHSTQKTFPHLKDINAHTRHKQEQSVSNKDRVEDDVMEEILQDPAKFEALLRQREKPPTKPVRKFVSPVPSRQSGRQRS